MRPALIYFGGKWKAAKWIIRFFPKHTIYVEPFGGAASILLQKKISKIEIYNDLSSDVYNFFWVLRNRPKKLVKLTARTPFSKEQYDKKFLYLKSSNRVIRAWAFLYSSYMGIGGAPNTNGKTGFRGNSVKGSLNSQWEGVPENLIEIAIRLKKVILHHRDYRWVLDQYDSKNTLFYLDPPYVHSTRSGGGYNIEMKNEQHKKLLKRIKKLKGYVIISGYDNPIYRKLEKSGWKKFFKEMIDMQHNSKTECVWLSPRTYAAYREQTSSIFNKE